MNEIRGEYIRVVVAETLAEQHRLRHDDIDAVVLKTVATILTSFGIEEEDRQELRADFQHLRRWRKSVEQAQSFTFKAVITVIVTGFVGQYGSALRSCSANDPRYLVAPILVSFVRRMWRARAKGISNKNIELAKRCLR